VPELEEQLTFLAAAIEWPPTPNLSGRQLHLPARVEVAPEVRGRRRPLWQTRWALAAAAVLVIVATLLAFTPTREPSAGWLNLHVTINRVQNLPTPSPLPSAPLGRRLGLGDPTTLAAAQSHLGWKIQVPASLGAPDEVYLMPPPPTGPSGGEVTLVYSKRPDIPVSGLTGVSLLVTEARGMINENYFQKTLGPDVDIEQVTVGGHTGYWISGHPHNFVFTDADGNPHNDTLRLATNTLLFDDNGTLVRIEGELTKDQAIKIATSIG